ncbi:NAD(P)/FAD-dependent oxidoreductase [Ectothiorhodospiraceae bacterium 2226]|nr:NAD(P)/FAD-dependent oxidoreductase [Ectothiorhodospiraceae bacterium 2226]
MSTTELDVLIVGGGPAGSTLAWRLRGSGLRVGIVDKRRFPRDKVCAGWITPAVVQELALDLEDYGSGHVLQPITGFRVGMLGGRMSESDYGEVVSYGIRRCEFDHYLLARCGAELHLDTAVKSLRRDGGVWVVNEHLRAPLLVGAGGHFCPVARALGADLGRSEMVIAAQEVEFRLSPAQAAASPVRGAVPELYFCRDLKGYAWVFRKGEYLNVGLGREGNHRLAAHVSDFVAFLQREGRIPADAPSRFSGHAYLLYPSAPRPLTGEGALLIGDAAGLAYPQSGEGIRPAVESALLAAEAIAAAPEPAATDLAAYARAMTARFGPRQSKPAVSGALPPGLKTYLGGKLLGTRWFTRRVVMDRWFLHTHQAPLDAA